MGHFNDMKVEAGKNVEKLNESFSRLWKSVQTVQSNGEARLLGSPPGRALHSTAKTIGQSVQTLKSKSDTAISSAVSGVVADFNTLRRNVERNVQALRSEGSGEGTSDSQPSSPSASPSRSPSASASPSRSPPPAARVISFPTSTRDILADVVSPQAGNQTLPGQALLQQQQRSPSSASSEPPSDSIPSTSSTSSSPFSQNSEEVSEEEPHPDLSSVSATSVFSIGYLGPPLLGPTEHEGFVYRSEEAPKAGVDIALGVSSEASLLLKDVRRLIGKGLVVYKRIRALGIGKSSWENKMPWRNPGRATLVRGLQKPRQKFSSVKDRHEYHERARRRGRYLIGPTPGWSWFAADVILLYFLTNNPAGNFFI